MIPLVLALVAVMAGSLAIARSAWADLPEGRDPPERAHVHEETVSKTLTVETERGGVSDGSGLDCPEGACSRTVTYTRTCADADCPAYAFSTITLTLTPAPGYTAKWDGCTPQADPTRCDVALDSDRTVRVVWVKSVGDTLVDPDPVRDGSPVAPAARDSTGTTVSGTVETGAARGRGSRRGDIHSSVRYSFRRTETWTQFTALQVRNLPQGATVRAACRGDRCPKGAIVAAGRRTVSLDRLTDQRFRAGTVITVHVSKPGRRARTTRIAIRRGDDPHVKSRRAP